MGQNIVRLLHSITQHWTYRAKNRQQIKSTTTLRNIFTRYRVSIIAVWEINRCKEDRIRRSAVPGSIRRQRYNSACWWLHRSLVARHERGGGQDLGSAWGRGRAAEVRARATESLMTEVERVQAYPFLRCRREFSPVERNPGRSANGFSGDRRRGKLAYARSRCNPLIPRTVSRT